MTLVAHGIILCFGIATACVVLPTLRSVHVSVAVARALPEPTSGGAVSLDASGYVIARRQATVSAKVTDRVSQIYIEEGQTVHEGEIVAKLDDSNARASLNQAVAQLQYAEAELGQFHVNLANAERDLARKADLFDQHFVSQSAVDDAKTAVDLDRAQISSSQKNVNVAKRAVEVSERLLDDTVVRAPFSGVITVKAAQPGEIVSPISAGGAFTRTGLGTIVDMASLEINVDVNETFINRVTDGQRANARLNAYPDWVIPAHVIAIVPTADRSKGTVTVRLALDQQDRRILPEMGVRVSLLTNDPRPVVATGVLVQSSAIDTMSNADHQVGVVWVVHQGTLERRAVRLGNESPEGATVISGLAVGERVALGDHDKFRDGLHVIEESY